MEDLEQRVLQIRRAHESAKPTDRNPAWLNCSRDMTVMFAYIDELRAGLGQRISTVDKQTSSFTTLIAALRSQVSHMRGELEELHEAVNTLASERAANAMLTEELAVAAKKAARYDWLRHGDNDDLVMQHGPVAADFHWLPRNERLDDMIDFAMQAEAK